MPSSKPTILLLHGAFHPSSAWDLVIARLSAKGYRCLAPQLCFVGGTGTAISTWKPCVEQIQQLLLEETSAGRDVVVVNHSLGGLPGCSAIEGFTDAVPNQVRGDGYGRVKGLVQVTAMTIRDADHHREVFKNIPSDPDANGWKYPPKEVVKKIFFNDMDDEDAEKWTSLLLPNSATLDRSAEGLYPGYKDVPVWYIVCDNDLMLPQPIQEGFIDVIKEVNERVTVRHLASGHEPLLSKPDATADLVHEAASALTA